MSEKKIRAHLSYDGTEFVGWQKQPKGRSVQGELESALQNLFKQPVKVVGSGRTDSGVHARLQVAHFTLPKWNETMNLPRALNTQLPDSIVVKKAFDAPADFHACRSAEKKTYKFYISQDSFFDPCGRFYRYWYPRPIDLDWLRQASLGLVGKHDFRSFQAADSGAKTSQREIFAAQWKKTGNQVCFSICGDGFLKQMVRNIVGTLLDLQNKSAPLEALQAILEARDRQKAGPTAPAQGLFLHSVTYPLDLDNRCREL